MSDRFLYIYFMRDRADRIGQVVPKHVHYWQGPELPGCMGGPFADHSGGSTSFEARDRLEAEQLVAGDPFVEADLVSESWLKEWQVE